MDVSHPYKAVCPTVDGDVLQTLAATTMGLTGRQIALLTGRRSHSGVLRVLHRLTEHGLVDRVELNRTFLFSLNRDHLACPAVLELVGIRGKLHDKIKQDIDAWRVPPVHVSLFGSTARGDGDISSDVDLFVVRPEAVAADEPSWREQLNEIARGIERWTGNPAAIVERSEEEIGQVVISERPIIDELRSDAVVLTGVAIEALLEPV